MKHQEYYGGDIPFIKSGDIKSTHVSDGVLKLTKVALKETTAKLLPAGTVLVVVRSAILRNEFHIALADVPVVINQDVKAFQPAKDVLPEYLLWAIKSREDEILRNVQTMLTSHIEIQDLLNLKVKRASLDEQNYWVDFVRQSDKSKFAWLKSQFIEMFKYINREDYKTLNDVCSLITDGTHNPPKFVESGIPFILVSNITGNVVTYETPKYITENDYRTLMKRTPIEKGDVLLSTVGSYGHPAIVTEDRPFAFQRHIAHLKPKRNLLTSEYLHAAILSSIVQEQIELLILGVAQKTLNLSAIKQIQIPVPPIKEQNVFVSFVEQSDKSK